MTGETVILYAEDKPDDCRECYFWLETEDRCGRGEDYCFYITGRAPEPTPCTGCPYGKHSPCIGFCLKHVMGQDGISSVQDRMDIVR